MAEVDLDGVKTDRSHEARGLPDDLCALVDLGLGHFLDPRQAMCEPEGVRAFRRAERSLSAELCVLGECAAMAKLPRDLGACRLHRANEALEVRPNALVHVHHVLVDSPVVLRSAIGDGGHSDPTLTDPLVELDERVARHTAR